MNHHKNLHNNLLEGNIEKSLTKMTYSISLGFISLFTFNLIDTFFIAQLGSKQLAAVSFAFPIVFVWMNIFFGLNTGITAQIGKAIGQNDFDKTNSLVLNSLFFIIILSLIISIFGYLSINPLFKFLGTENSLLEFVQEYLKLWYVGFIFLALTMGFGAIIRGQGDTSTPSRILVYSAFLNGVLDPLLIFGIGPFPRLEISGAMLATVISWIFACLLSFRHIIINTNLLDKANLQLKNFLKIITITFIHDIKRILAIGLPSVTTNIINPISTVIIIKIVAIEGFTAVAGFGVGAKLEALAVLISISLSIAIVPFVSINHGAKNYARINYALKYAIRLIFFIQLLIYLILFLLAKNIAYWFSNDQAVINVIILYLRIIPGSYCFIGIIAIILSALNSIEHAKYSTLINIIRFFILTIPCAYFGRYLYGITGILIGIVIAKIFAFIIALAVYRKVTNNLLIQYD